ncbi:MAG: hypothetical protein HZC40_22875 [Chloroflexi bacterium]|nr:hypothetical protein [Chloroflexota bacterium]
MLTESRAQTTIRYATEPVVVANACQRTLRLLGEVTHVSRETGSIAGKLKLDWLTNSVLIDLTITKKGDETELSISTQRKEGALTSGGAQNGLQRFLHALAQDKELQGKSASGW